MPPDLEIPLRENQNVEQHRETVEGKESETEPHPQQLALQLPPVSSQQQPSAAGARQEAQKIDCNLNHLIHCGVFLRTNASENDVSLAFERPTIMRLI